MRATRSQMSRIRRKRELPGKVLRIRKGSMLFMFAKRGRFNVDELKRLSERIGKQLNLKMNVVMCDDTGGRDMEFIGIEVV
jgi:hypothetical protein